MSSPGILGPTGTTQRISSLDIIRGVALLGILLMNITGFGLPHAYSDPTVAGGATGWNLKVWWMNNMFFEGTMRGMFSMLFGAGIVLFTSRTPADPNDSIADIFFRRLLWLFLFGIIHAYLLLWHGEILYPYALVGMFVFSFRHWAPRQLIIGAGVLMLFSTALTVYDYSQTQTKFDKAEAATEKKESGQTISKEDSLAVAAWDNTVADQKPPQEVLDEEIEAYQQGYFNIVMHKASLNRMMQTFVMYRYFFLDIFAMMLLGVAFFKSGIFTGKKSNRYYLGMVIAGYAIGLSINYFESSYLISHNFSVVAIDFSAMSYDWGRVFTTVGHVGLIMLFIKSGALPFLQRSLAAVGQMAFTNYIMHTIICNTIFLGFGFSLYGRLQRYELYYVVIGIWVLQLILSPIWLRFFRFGPMEWIWRSLTYWKKQPFRRKQETPEVMVA